MKIYPDKLADHLRGTLLPLYLVSGDEPLLVQESCDEIRAALRMAGYLERDLFHVEGTFDWQQVLYSNNSLSLFAEKKIIELRMSSAKPGTTGAKALTELAVLNDNCVLLVLPRLDASTQKSKWFKTLESAGGLVQVWPVDAGELPGWIRDRFTRAGLRASRDAVLALADRIEGNLLAAVQEIERIKLCATDAEVSVELVLGSVADSSRYDVFLLIDAAVAGNATRAVKIIDGLRREGVDPLYVNSMLAREIRSLVSMSFQVGQGKSVDAVLRSARVWNKRKRAVTSCLKRQRVNDLERMQARLGTVDRMVKGLVPGRPWDELASTVVSLSGR